MSSARQNLSSGQMVNVKGIDHFHFTIITAEWNKEVTYSLEKACIESLIEAGIPKNKIQIFKVPGTWELVPAAYQAIHATNTNAVICLGCVIRGETPHFEYICQGVTNGLAQLNANQSVPVIFGILTVENHQQAMDRCGGIHGNKGVEAALTAIKMIQLNHLIKGLDGNS